MADASARAAQQVLGRDAGHTPAASHRRRSWSDAWVRKSTAPRRRNERRHRPPLVAQRGPSTASPSHSARARIRRQVRQSKGRTRALTCPYPTRWVGSAVACMSETLRLRLGHARTDRGRQRRRWRPRGALRLLRRARRTHRDRGADRSSLRLPRLPRSPGDADADDRDHRSDPLVDDAARLGQRGRRGLLLFYRQRDSHR